VLKSSMVMGLPKVFLHEGHEMSMEFRFEFSALRAGLLTGLGICFLMEACFLIGAISVPLDIFQKSKPNIMALKIEGTAMQT